jgi:hypothetical protein
MSLFRPASCTYRQRYSSEGRDMNLYAGLLFLHGHITNIDLARQLAEPQVEAATDATVVVAADPSGDMSAQDQCARKESVTPSAPRSASPCGKT